MTDVHPIRIALVVTELEVGGAERCLVNLATRLDRQRFQPAVYCLAPRPADDELIQQVESAAIPVHCLGARSAWHFLATKSGLQQLLRVQSPHLVQTFLFHANVVGALAARRIGGARIVLGIRVADPTWWRQRLESRIARLADRIVCVSHSVAKFVRVRARVPERKLVVIPNGIDLTAIDATPAADLRQMGVPKGRKVIAFVGRLHRQKGLDAFLPVVPHVLQRLPEHDLLIVGDGPQRRALSRLTNSLQIASRVHFVGRRRDVAAILHSSSALVLPSRWEGMPNVLLEAMATRLPVVATDAAGIEELLGEMAESQLVRCGDMSALAERLVTIAKDPALAASLGEMNRRRVSLDFSLTAMVGRYESLYESLVQGVR